MYPKQKAFHNHIFVFDLHRSFCVNPCHLWETITHPASGRSDKSVINIYTSSIRGIGAIRVRNIKTKKHY